MRWWDTLQHRLRSLFRGRQADRELARELRAHLDDEIAARVAGGATAAEARQDALRAFGPLALVEEQCRDTRRVTRLDHLRRDLRSALRMLVRQPGLFAAATASIALGAGANLTIFSLANSLLFAVPTTTRPSELVQIRMDNGSHVSYAAWQQLDASGALAAVAGYQFEESVNWRQGAESASLVPLLVTANFFDVAGVPMSRGRGFTASEARAELRPHLVVVSDGFWQRALAGDPQAIGRTIVLNGEPYTITGVLARGVRSMAGFGLAPNVYLPLSRDLVPGLDRPRSAAAQLFGRLRPGQSIAAGRAALSAVVARMAAAEAKSEFRTVRDFAPVGGLTQLREFKELGAFFLVLFVVSMLVVALACANVAGLLVARGLARRREIAMRLALGASRGRLIQQLLTESFVLSVAGTLAGGAITAAAFALLARVPLPLPLPVDLRLAIDWRALTLAAALIAASTIVTGLAPALQATRPALLPALKLDDPPVLARVRLRSLLVVGQVAGSVVLLVAALLFVRSLARATVVDPGFDADRTLAARVSFVEGRQGTPARQAIEDVVERVRAVPGVEAAAFAAGVPLTIFSGGRIGTQVRIAGVDAPVRVDFDDNDVGPDYFRAMGIRVLRGRAFTSADRAGAPSTVLINDAFARRYLDGRDPIGVRIVFDDSHPLGDEIIGVVATSKYRSLAEDGEPAVYWPMLGGREPQRLVHLIVRAAGGDPAALGPAVRDAVLAADRSSAVVITPVRDALSFAVLPSRMGSLMLGLLGAVGTMLAMVGLFGVVSFAVSRRTREIAIRVALGASRAGVVRLVVEDVARLVGSGLAIGLLLAWLATKPLSAFLVAGVRPGDPLSYAAATALLLAASMAAIWSPALRALGVAPTRALKVD